MVRVNCVLSYVNLPQTNKTCQFFFPVFCQKVDDWLEFYVVTKHLEGSNEKYINHINISQRWKEVMPLNTTRGHDFLVLREVKWNKWNILPQKSYSSEVLPTWKILSQAICDWIQQMFICCLTKNLYIFR